MALLSRPLRLLASLTVTFAFVTLWLHPGLDHPLAVGLAALLLWPALALPAPVPWRRWRLAWNGVIVLALGPAVGWWLLVPARGLEALVALAVLAELRWAHNPGGARQARLMVALATVLIVLTAPATESVWYPVLAGLFFICALGTLLWSEIALGYEQTRHPVPREVIGEGAALRGRRLWLPPLRLAALSMALGMGLFFLFPRSTTGGESEALVASDLVSEAALTGMANQIELGAFERLLQDPTPALRVTWLDGAPAESVYLRGNSLTHLERTGDRWVWHNADTDSVERNCPSDAVTPLRGAALPAGAIGQRVEVLDPGLRTIFALPWLAGVQGPGGVLIRESGDHWRVRNFEERWPIYEAWSSPDALGSSEEPEAARAPNLSLPEDLRRRVREHLFREGIVSPNDPAAAGAEAIRHHLASTRRHSLDLRGIRGSDPLEDFLFQRRAGHCEHFASAMAVMCRAVNIPARIVTGFLGGEETDDGGLLVRRQDAHAWVEVWDESDGWVTMDPTPPAPLVASTQGGMWEGVTSLVGRLSTRWSSQFIHYDGLWHGRMLRWTAERGDRFVARITGEPGLFRRSMAKIGQGLAEEPILWIFIAVIAVVNFLFAWIERRWRRHGLPWHRRHRVPNEALLSRIAHALTRRPRARRPGETVAEYLRALTSEAPRAEVHGLIHHYYAWRFDPAESRLGARDLITQARALRTQSLT